MSESEMSSQNINVGKWGVDSPLSDSTSTGYCELEFNRIEQFESDTLLSIDAQLQGSEMSRSERLFLNGIIRKARPKKIVEYGVSAGGSAAVILNAIKDIPGAKLYSLDYAKRYYRDSSKLVGWMIPEKFPHLADKWECLSGGVCCQFLDQITNNGKDKIDVCLLDTVHQNPGEFLNILEVLPYMKQNGIIVMHDTALHTLGSDTEYTVTCCICLNTLNGRQIILWDETPPRPIISNIGAIILDDNIAEMLYPLFTNLSLPWFYRIGEEDYRILLGHFQKHYPSELAVIFEKAYRYYNNRRRHIPFTIRLPWVRREKDAEHSYFKVFGFTFKIKRKKRKR